MRNVFIFFLNDEHLSVDESMLPYYGRHSSKQRILGKPVRMGYKVWVLASSDGYVVQFEPYQGPRSLAASTRSSGTSWGLGENVVLDLLEELPCVCRQFLYISQVTLFPA